MKAAPVEESGDLLHEARIDALIRERPYEWSAETVVAHTAEEGDARPEEGRGGGLVGPLAAVVGRKTGVRDRLAWRGTALHAQDEVLVYRTNDEDVSHSEKTPKLSAYLRLEASRRTIMEAITSATALTSPCRTASVRSSFMPLRSGIFSPINLDQRLAEADGDPYGQAASRVASGSCRSFCSSLPAL